MYVTEKDRELGIAHGEMKALKATEVLKDKAVEEVPILTYGLVKNSLHILWFTCGYF